MSGKPIFLPKLFTCLRGYTKAHFLRDLAAGVTVGVVALPLALAFGIASIPEDVAASAGMSPPAMGLFTGVIAGFLISALGGSRVAIGGPTGAFVGIVYLIAATHGHDGLVLATLMAGALLIIMGLAQLGGLIKFIPYPVTTGFTSGIAVVIAAGQIKDFLGLEMGPLPPEFLERMGAYGRHIGTTNPAAVGIGVGTIAVIMLMRRFVTKRIPGPIVAIALATFVVQIFGIDTVTIGDRFGAIPTGLPAPRLPSIDWARAPELIGPALTIALLAGIESLLCAVVADGMLGTKHRSNTELIAQGVANIVTPVFGGIPATGAIARTATNVQAGGRTPIAGIIHAITLLAIIMALGRFATMIPLASLSGVLMIVAWNMAERHSFQWLLKAPKSDAIVLLTTFSLTVLIDLTVAVQVGMVLAVVLFMKRMADVTNVSAIRNEMHDEATDAPLPPLGRSGVPLPPGVELYEIDGPFFFGAAYKMREALDSVSRPPAVLLLDLTRVPAIDASGLHALYEIRRKAALDGSHTILVGVHAQPFFAMDRAGLIEQFGADAFAGTVAEAVLRAQEILEAHPPKRSVSRM